MATIKREITVGEWEVSASGIKISTQGGYLKPDEWTAMMTAINNRLNILQAMKKSQDTDELPTSGWITIRVGAVIPGDFINGTASTNKDWYAYIRSDQTVQRKNVAGYEPVTAGNSRGGDLYWDAEKAQWLPVENTMPAQVFYALIRKRGA